MNISEQKLSDIKCCARETLLIVNELETLEKEIFRHRDLAILLLQCIPDEFQNIDKIMQKLSIISSFLSNLEIENLNSSHKPSINIFENSLFSNSIYEDK